MLENEAYIVRIYTLAMVKVEAEVKERVAKEVLSNIRSKMEAELSERERA